MSELVDSNRRVLAERLNWPAGAVAACEELEQSFPGWHVMWLPECVNRGFEHPAGFWALYDHAEHHVEILRADPAEAAELMAAVPREHDYGFMACDWCVAHPPLPVSGRRVKI